MNQKPPFNIVEDLAWQSLGRAICIPRGPERGRLYDALDGLLSEEAREAHIALDNFLSEEEAEGIEYTIRFLYGLLTGLESSVCAKMLEMGEIMSDQALEDLLREATRVAGLPYIAED